MENENKLILNKTIYHGSLPDTVQVYQEGPFKYGVMPGFVVNPILMFAGINVPVISTTNYNKFSSVNMSANAGNIVYCGYLRNSSGNGFTTWARDAHAELKTIEQIYMDMYTAQYNQPYNTISGSFTADILFSPIDTLLEVRDGKKYIPTSLEIGFKSSFYNADFSEMTSVADADIDLDDPADDGAGFTTGFSLGFDS